MKIRILITIGVILAIANCGRNMGVVRSSLAKKPKIGILASPANKLWVQNQQNKGTGAAPDEMFAAKVDAPKEVDAIGKLTTQEIKK